jgi:hypothetical protein
MWSRKWKEKEPTGHRLDARLVTFVVILLSCRQLSELVTTYQRATARDHAVKKWRQPDYSTSKVAKPEQNYTELSEQRTVRVFAMTCACTWLGRPVYSRALGLPRRTLSQAEAADMSWYDEHFWTGCSARAVVDGPGKCKTEGSHVSME